MGIDMGVSISEEDRKSIVDGLSHLPADTYVLYLKTHNFHWNVSGPMFRTLHLMFEEQYNELALAVDSIAERIRVLGFPAPGTYTTYARLSSIKEEEDVPKAEDMIRSLVQGQEAVVRTARSLFPLLGKVSDEPAADLLTQRMQVHERTAWMLRSMLESNKCFGGRHIKCHLSVMRFCFYSNPFPVFSIPSGRVWLPLQRWLACKRGAERIPLLRDGGVAVEYVNIKYLSMWFSLTHF